MAKNVTIMENKVQQTYTGVKKIRTNLVGEGTQNWIPEDEAADYAKIKKGSFNENGTYYAEDDDKDAYNEIKVRVPTERLKLKSLKVTQNGVYSAEEQGADGFNGVSVNVSGGGGGGGAEYTFKWTKISDEYRSSYDKYVECNGCIYGINQDGTVYVFDGTSWGNAPHTGWINVQQSSLVRYNNELHWIMGNLHKVLRGGAWVEVESVPFDCRVCGSIESGGLLHVCGGNIGSQHWVYNGSTWAQAGALPFSVNRPPIFDYDGALYFINNKKYYIYDGSGWTEAGNIPINGTPTYGVTEIAGKKRVHMGGSYNDVHHSFNGSFWRPEEWISGYNIPYISSINGVLYAIRNSDGMYRAEVVLKQ